MISTSLHPANDRLGFMLFLAACLHAFIILGISFDLEDPKKPQHRQQSLEVMVVQHPKELPKEEEQPDFLAQTSQSGGGQQDERAKPTTEALHAPAVTHQATQQSAAIPEAPKSQKQSAITQEISSHQRPAGETDPSPELQPRPTMAQLFASKQQEIARLTAELERKTRAYAKLPKRKSISASTKEYKYAAYLDAWRRKVERIGNLNYPDEAKRRKLHGNLILHVAVKADGSLEQVQVLHSSGHKLLDDAAVRIVRLAAPYSPFPNEIRKETDILDITRTWQFLRSNLLDSR